MKTKLFCFPYAGGTSSIFHRWRTYLDKSIELRPIELAGRGKRITEPLYENLEEMIGDIYDVVQKELHQCPYAFFGHSMGAVIAYELVKLIKKEGQSHPEHIFFSGRYAPHIRSKRQNLHLLPDEEFTDEILKLGGISEEVFKHSELIKFFIPILKNDFRLAETYAFDQNISPFDCDITIFIGKDEGYSEAEITEWKMHTQGSCSIYYFPGDHFFINRYEREITNCISFKILRELKADFKIR